MKSKWWLAAFGICLLAAVLSALASSSPDGMEKVAEDKGFLGLATDSPFRIMAGYVVPGIHNEAIATIIAGVIGTSLLFGIVYGLAFLLVSAGKRRAAKARS